MQRKKQIIQLFTPHSYSNYVYIILSQYGHFISILSLLLKASIYLLLLSIINYLLYSYHKIYAE